LDDHAARQGAEVLGLMADRAYYRCPVPGCGEVIEGEAVVDPGFGVRLEVHKARHNPDRVAWLEDSTIICALTMYAVEAADPSTAILLLEKRGVADAETLVIEARAKRLARR
jgi:hypothetical protein